MTTPNLPDADSLLMGGGIPSAKFPNIGDTVTGVIESKPEVQQQRDYDTDELLWWDDGKPRLQIKVVLRTNQRDPDIDDDQGLRALYLKAQLQSAVRDAVKASGAKGLEVGGTLTVTYDHDGVTNNKKFNPPKQYVASYTPPNVLDQAAGEAPSGIPSKPAQPSVPAVERPENIAPQMWDALDDAQKAAVAAAAGK